MSEVELHITAKFKNGEPFEAVGEVTFHDRYIVVYDVDGGAGYLFYENLLYLLTETRPRPQESEGPADAGTF